MSTLCQNAGAVPVFLGLPAASVGYMGLVIDALSAIPPENLGAELGLLEDAYKAVDWGTGDRVGLHVARIRTNVANGRADCDMVETACRDLGHVFRATTAQQWSSVVDHMKRHGLGDIPVDERTPAFEPKDVGADVRMARARLSSQRVSLIGNDIERELDSTWDATSNIVLPSGKNIPASQDRIVETMKSLRPKDVPRLASVLDILAREVLVLGMDPFACVAAHGPTDITSILQLLDAGFVVVSREIAVVHEIVMDNFPELKEFARAGRFVRSPVHEPHPNLPYSLGVWASPYYPTKGWLDGRFPPVTPDTLIDNCAEGAMVLLQTDCPDGFIEPFARGHRGFRSVWERGGITAANYLMPSTQVLIDKSRAALLRGASVASG